MTLMITDERELRKDIQRGNLLSILPLLKMSLETSKEELTCAREYEQIRFKQGQCSILKEYISLLTASK